MKIALSPKMKKRCVENKCRPKRHSPKPDIFVSTNYVSAAHAAGGSTTPQNEVTSGWIAGSDTASDADWSPHSSSTASSEVSSASTTQSNVASEPDWSPHSSSTASSDSCFDGATVSPNSECADDDTTNEKVSSHNDIDSIAITSTDTDVEYISHGLDRLGIGHKLLSDGTAVAVPDHMNPEFLSINFSPGGKSLEVKYKNPAVDTPADSIGLP